MGTLASRLNAVFTKMVDRGIGLIPDLLAALVIALLTLAVACAFRRTLRAVLKRNDVQGEVVRTLERLVFWPILLVGLFVALTELNVDFAVLGIEVSLLGVAIGFALKDLLTNLVSGIMIVLSRPFAAGDQIRIKDFEGTVESIGWRGTVLKTYDGRRVIIPNMDVFTNAVTNNTAYPVRRSSVFVGVAVDTDLGKAEEAVRVALKTVPEVVQDPAPEVLVKKLGDFTIDFEIRIWTPAPQSEMLRVNSEATCAVKEAFDSLGIDMPFPTQVMYVHREAVTRNDEEIPPGAD